MKAEYRKRSTVAMQALIAHPVSRQPPWLGRRIGTLTPPLSSRASLSPPRRSGADSENQFTAKGIRVPSVRLHVVRNSLSSVQILNRRPMPDTTAKYPSAKSGSCSA